MGRCAVCVPVLWNLADMSTWCIGLKIIKMWSFLLFLNMISSFNSVLYPWKIVCGSTRTNRVLKMNLLPENAFILVCKVHTVKTLPWVTMRNVILIILWITIWWTTRGLLPNHQLINLGRFFEEKAKKSCFSTFQIQIVLFLIQTLPGFIHICWFWAGWATIMRVRERSCRQQGWCGREPHITLWRCDTSFNHPAQCKSESDTCGRCLTAFLQQLGKKLGQGH